MKIGPLLLILALVLPGTAQVMLPHRHLEGGPVANPCVYDSPYIIEQNLEGPGFDHCEVWYKTGDVNDLNNTNVIEGSYSLAIAQSGAKSSAVHLISAGATNDVYFFAKMIPIAINAGGNADIMLLQEHTNSTTVRILTQPTGEMRIFINSSATTVSKLTVGTTYNVWVHSGPSGADWIGEVAFSTTGTQPTSGNNYAKTTTLSATPVPIERLLLGSIGNDTQGYIWDHIRLSSTPLGDNPP